MVSVVDNFTLNNNCKMNLPKSLNTFILSDEAQYYINKYILDYAFNCTWKSIFLAKDESVFFAISDLFVSNTLT